jgi:hypothetical protein
MATALQAIGTTAIAIGAGIIYLPAGIILGGLFATAFGIVLERNAR